jgi:hypothetical protein
VSSAKSGKQLAFLSLGTRRSLLCCYSLCGESLFLVFDATAVLYRFRLKFSRHHAEPTLNITPRVNKRANGGMKGSSSTKKVMKN